MAFPFYSPRRSRCGVKAALSVRPEVAADGPDAFWQQSTDVYTLSPAVYPGRTD